MNKKNEPGVGLPFEARHPEDVMKEAESNFRTIFNLSSDGMLVVRLTDKKITDANKKICDMLGYKKKELLDLKLSDIHPAGYLPHIVGHGKQPAEREIQSAREVPLLRKDGSVIYADETDSALDVNGKECRIVIFRDISESRRAKDLLNKSERFFKEITENSWDIIIITDREGMIKYCSPSIERFTGYKPDEVIGQSGFMFIHPDEIERAANDFDEAVQLTDEPIPTNAFRIIHKDGSERYFYGIGKNLLDNPDIDGIVMNVRDITDRRRIEDSLIKSEENFHRSLDESPLGMRISTIDGETIYANKAILDIYGYDSIEELRNTSLRERYTPWTYEEYEIRRAQRLKGEPGPTEYDISVVRKNGEIRHLHVFRKEIFWSGSKRYLVIYQDITERKKAQEESRESEDKYRTILENIEDGYYEVDLAGNFIFFNESMCKILGYSREEMAGMNNRRYTDSEYSKKLFQAFNKVYRTGKTTKEFDWQIIRKDGVKRYIEASVSLLRDMQDKPTGFRGIVSDITERKVAEEKLKRTLESLKRAAGTTIQVLVSALEVRDPYTAGHQSRAADLACAIATEMGLDKNKIEGIRMAGIIHDIGKLSVPSEILTKPASLTKLEYLMVQEHPRSGYEMLKDVESPWPLAEIVLQHHERINGTGYPRNLKVGDILLESRILAIADVVEAMASHRPYRASLGIEAALEEIEKNKGTLYDETAVDACLRLFREKGYHLI